MVALCRALIVLSVALLLSPKVTPPNFFDNAIERLLDYLSPIEPWTPLAHANSSSWPDILPPRSKHCPPVYDSCEVAHAFRPLPTDVIVTTAPKTGTTLVQFMAHLIRSGGDMNFTDLCDVAPWILVNPLYNGDAAEVEQPGWPRVFKNHQSLAEFRGGRHILVLRDPAAVLRSWYAFSLARSLPFLRHDGYLHIASSLPGLPGLPPSVAAWLFGDTWKSPLELQGTSLGWRRDMSFGLSLLTYYVEFWHVRHDPNVLLLCYEDLVSERSRWIPVIARFMGVQASPELVERVAQMTSKDFMLGHIDKFDGSGYAGRINEQGRVSVQWQGSTKVTDARHEELSPASLETLQREWSTLVTPSTGLSSYSAMREAWQREASGLA